MELRLNSLCGYNPLIYRWPFDFKEQGCELIEAINLACQEEPPLRKHLNDILANCTTNSYESMKMVCQTFNQAVDNLRSLIKSGLYHPQPKASVELLHHILQICYNRAVIDPDKLNHYEPFSAEVYGETSFELVHQMIQTIRFTESDRFIDLGSGVGHVVLQVAAATPCKSCYGIEKAHWPALYAQQMSSEFEKWMKFYGKDYGAYELLKGNFLSDDFKDVISNATVIFVNNFAFGPQVDHELKLKFSNLKEGTKIVSSKAFCAMNMQISERNLSDIGAILTVEELSPLRGPVSWTPKRVTYYLHTIDRTQLEEYFRRKQNPSLKKSSSRKSITMGTPKTTKQLVSTQAKTKPVKSKLWKKKSLPTKRPSTISMLSTITADASPRLFNNNGGGLKFHDSLNMSESPLPCYVFPSARALTFDDSDPPPQMIDRAESFENADRATKTPTTARYQFLPSKAGRKLTEKSPFGSPSCDILFGFGINENEISEELLAEIDNIINLFHDETVKITFDEDYKSKEIFNDSLLLKSFYDMKSRKSGPNESKNDHISLSSLTNYESSKLPYSSKSTDQSQPTTTIRKTCTYSPSIVTKKISVSIPRLSSPVTPDTPTTSLDKKHCVKKCIPFFKPEKQISPVSAHFDEEDSSNVDVFLPNSNPKSANPGLELPSSNTMIVGPLKQDSQESVVSMDPVRKTYQPSLKLTIQCQNERYKSSANVKPTQHRYATPDTTPGDSVQLMPQITSLPLSSSFASNECRLPPFASRTNDKVDFLVPVSFPRHILDNSQSSTDELSLLSSSTLTPSCENGVAHGSDDNNDNDDDDDDPPEMSALLDKFRSQYRRMIKVMKSSKFKTGFANALNYEKNRQDALRHQVYQLNRELQELQLQNDILLHQLTTRNPEQTTTRNTATFHSSVPLRQDPFFAAPESPDLLNRATYLDGESVNCRSESRLGTADQSCFPAQALNDNFDENDEEVKTLCTGNPLIKNRAPSPDIEMPLLLPEPTNLRASAQSSEPGVEDRNPRSNFCPPPRLTVCVDGLSKKGVPAGFGDAKASADVGVYNNSINKTSSHSQLSLLSSYPTDKPPTVDAMCFSPISSCGSASPVTVAKAPDSEVGSKELFLEEESFKSYQRSHIACVSSLPSSVYYSALSNALQDCYYSKSFCEASHLQKGFSSEESGPSLANRKRKSSGSCESASRSKKMPNQTEFLANVAECFDANGVVSKNLLQSKCLTDPSSVDSRSDSRDSGYGKESETDNETTNKLGQPRGAALAGHKMNIKHPYNVDQPQRRHLGLLMVEDTTVTNGANSFGSKENCYQSPLDHKSRNSHLCNYENAFQPMPAVTDWNRCNNSTLVNNQLPQQFGSFELSFASLASYYEKCSANGNGFIDPGSFRNPQNHSSHKKHKFSTDFT